MTDVAVVPHLTVLPGPDAPEPLLAGLAPAARPRTVTPPTAMAAAAVLVLGTCSPSDLRGHKARMTRPCGADGGMVAGGTDGKMAG